MDDQEQVPQQEEGEFINESDAVLVIDNTRNAGEVQEPVDEGLRCIRFIFLFFEEIEI